MGSLCPLDFMNEIDELHKSEGFFVVGSTRQISARSPDLDLILSLLSQVSNQMVAEQSCCDTAG
jgi:hypothetical protein